MTKTRAPYAAEFREQMVELVASGRRPQERAIHLAPQPSGVLVQL